MDAATNLQNMKKLDDSWNGQDLQTFRKYHAKDCIVRWPNQPPTLGVDAHEQEAIAFFKMFPDQHLINNPYKIMLAQGEWTAPTRKRRKGGQSAITSRFGFHMPRVEDSEGDHPQICFYSAYTAIQKLESTLRPLGFCTRKLDAGRGPKFNGLHQSVERSACPPVPVCQTHLSLGNGLLGFVGRIVRLRFLSSNAVPKGSNRLTQSLADLRKLFRPEYEQSINKIMSRCIG